MDFYTASIAVRLPGTLQNRKIVTELTKASSIHCINEAVDRQGGEGSLGTDCCSAKEQTMVHEKRESKYNSLKGEMLTYE